MCRPRGARGKAAAVETQAPAWARIEWNNLGLHGSAGVVATACRQGEQAQHGRPNPVVSDCEVKTSTSDHQPDAREGPLHGATTAWGDHCVGRPLRGATMAGPGWELDRPIVPRKRVTNAEGRGLR